MSAALKAVGNVAALALIWVAVVAAMGVVARVAKEVFCIGYGC